MEMAEARFRPFEIDVDAALPTIFERADFGLIAPDDLVDAVREERWIEVDEVNAVGWELRKRVQVVIAVDNAGLEVAAAVCTGPSADA